MGIVWYCHGRGFFELEVEEESKEGNVNGFF